MFRPILPEDTPVLLSLTTATGVFGPHEVEALHEVLDDYHAQNQAHGHRAFLLEEEGTVLGYVYYAPAAMTDRTWYLYWIAVRPTRQAGGIGTALLRHAEADIRERQGRVLFIETSSLPHYEPTRRFYLKQGYEVTGILRDYYRDGDDMVVFRKRLEG